MIIVKRKDVFLTVFDTLFGAEQFVYSTKNIYSFIHNFHILTYNLSWFTLTTPIHDLLFDLPDRVVDRSLRGVYNEVGLLVKPGAAFKELPYLGLGIFGPGQRPVRPVFDAFIDHLGPRGEADHEAALAERRAILIPYYRPSAR